MELINSKYNIQAVDLVELAAEMGTPLYVYDADRIATQVQKLKHAFPGINLGIKYAIKALSNISILKLLKKLEVGMDAVSIQEVELAMKAGFAPTEIQYSPNGVEFKEFIQAVDLGVMINIDNLPMLEKFGQTYGSTVPVCIRLNPHIMAGGHLKISTGHIDSKFGISLLQLNEILEVVNQYKLNVTGLHIHTGSDIIDSEVFLKGAKFLFDAAMQFPELDYIDFGSGLKVSYWEDDPATDIEDLGGNLKQAFDEFSQAYGREVSIWFEPGKFLVSEAGWLLVQANVVKTTPATVFVGVNSGMNHLIRPMMYDSYHHIINLSNPGGHERVYSVVGYICETDTLGWNRKLAEVTPGDILAFKNAGAYGFSMASNYNSRLRPAEVLIYQGKAHLIRQRETMEDLVRNQIDIEL
ncbi:MAG: diaminopimelate decarboxylase [Cyclobacteriaceae bacterium]